MVVFEPASVYGVREGYHSGLLVTSQDKGNVFWRSPVYKNGVVSGVTMLPRILCFKSLCLGSWLLKQWCTEDLLLAKDRYAEG